MMVRLSKRVECSAKIAMTTLPEWFSTMGLLPKPDFPREHFSRPPRRAHLLISN
jgi:hypothetical protein